MVNVITWVIVPLGTASVFAWVWWKERKRP
jgi:hypothetical protein